MTFDWPVAPARVVAGHGVASGRAADSPYPAGTIALQAPHFAARGLDLSGFYPGTLNLDIAPWQLEPRQPRFTATLNWHDEVTERFSFVDARLRIAERSVAGLIYHPHPDTKPAHHQPSTVVELLAPWIEGLGPGTLCELAVDPAQAEFCRA